MAKGAGKDTAYFSTVFPPLHCLGEPQFIHLPSEGIHLVFSKVRLIFFVS